MMNVVMQGKQVSPNKLLSIIETQEFFPNRFSYERGFKIPELQYSLRHCIIESFNRCSKDDRLLVTKLLSDILNQQVKILLHRKKQVYTKLTIVNICNGVEIYNTEDKCIDYSISNLLTILFDFVEFIQNKNDKEKSGIFFNVDFALSTEVLIRLVPTLNKYLYSKNLQDINLVLTASNPLILYYVSSSKIPILDIDTPVNIYLTKSEVLEERHEAIILEKSNINLLENPNVKLFLDAVNIRLEETPLKKVIKELDEESKAIKDYPRLKKASELAAILAEYLPCNDDVIRIQTFLRVKEILAKGKI